MLKIKLKLIGKKKRPFYKIVIAENLAKRDGKNLKAIGAYDPIQKVFRLNKDDLRHYLNEGAQPTSRVRHLLCKMVSEHSFNS